MKRTVEKDDQVSFHLVIRLSDGSVVLDTSNEEPFELSMLDKSFPQKVIGELIGMAPGDTKTINLSPEEGYGDIHEELMRKVPLETLPEDIKIGQILSSQEDNRQWAVEDLGEHFAVLNGNHPLAGQSLTFEVALVSIGDSSSSSGTA